MEIYRISLLFGQHRDIDRSSLKDLLGLSCLISLVGLPLYTCAEISYYTSWIHISLSVNQKFKKEQVIIQ
jgi:hypothetical protein